LVCYFFERFSVTKEISLRRVDSWLQAYFWKNSNYALCFKSHFLCSISTRHKKWVYLRGGKSYTFNKVVIEVNINVDTSKPSTLPVRYTTIFLLIICRIFYIHFSVL